MAFAAFGGGQRAVQAGEEDDLQREIDTQRVSVADLERLDELKATGDEITQLRSWLDEAWGLRSKHEYDQVREVLELPLITRVPTAPAYMRGVVNVRGKAVPVVGGDYVALWAARVLTVVYFLFFVLMPWYTANDKEKPVTGEALRRLLTKAALLDAAVANVGQSDGSIANAWRNMYSDAPHPCNITSGVPSAGPLSATRTFTPDDNARMRAETPGTPVG